MVDSLHEHAVQAEKHLEQLATGMADQQVDPSMTETVTKMADVARKIVSALGKGQEATADDAPPEDSEPGEQPHTIASATDAMMAQRHA